VTAQVETRAAFGVAMALGVQTRLDTCTKSVKGKTAEDP